MLLTPAQGKGASKVQRGRRKEANGETSHEKGSSSQKV